MTRKYVSTYLIILFFCLFYLIKSEGIEYIDYNFQDNYSDKTIDYSAKKQTFLVDFSEKPTEIPFYLKITATSNDNNLAPLLYFSNTDPNCDERGHLVKNPNEKSVFFWIKREEFERAEQELYFMVECEKEGCAYTVSVEGDQHAVFGPNFSYSYLITANSREMVFYIQGTEKNVYMTASIDGSSQASINTENILGSTYNYKTGSTITFFLGENEINYSNLAVITVRDMEIGDYITLSVHLVNNTEIYQGVAQNGLIVPNGPEITGYLEENIINEECFPIDLSNEKYKNMNQLYITGKIHTKYAWFYLENENREYLDETFKEILDGQLSYAMNNNKKMNYICFELPSESTIYQTNLVFTFSITEPNSLSDFYNFYPPQLTGEIFRRMIPKGKIVFFSGTKNDNTAKKYDYNLYQIKGVTKMYIGDCRKYPHCNYGEDELSNLYDPKNTNQMSIWTTLNDESSAIDSDKYVIVAQCLDDDNNNNGYCEFETSIFSRGQDITLIEDEKFSKFCLNDENGYIIADLQNGRQVQRLTFDIMIFSGDITFNIKETQITYDKYYLSNKIYIHCNLGQSNLEKVTIEYSAIINSFFTIQYGMHSYNLEQLSENIPSGESYLLQIDPTSSSRTKNIFLSNMFYKTKNQFLANFFEINCQFEVKRGDNTIDFFDGYGQEILNSTSEDYSSPSYQYTIKITETDLSNYNHKMCMLYVAGYESETNVTNYEREIVIGNNINQQIIFNNNFKKIRFLYPYSDKEKDMTLHINVVDKAFYRIKVFSKTTMIRQAITAKSQIIYLRASLLAINCDDDLLCPITVQVEFETQIVKTDPMIEITLRELKNVPTYLQKGQAKLDYVCGDNYYYLYTDIGKNEIGEITINFLREFGYLWAKVVRKDQTVKDTNANWRDIYRMPSEEYGDSLYYNGYTKKLVVTDEDTGDCIEGCYLLISIQISQIGQYVEDYKFYPFSIITKITPNSKSYTEFPKVVIQVDEYIIGNVEVSDSSNIYIYEFFEIWLPHDSDIVVFDWQSSVAGLYINVGGIRPTVKNADFKLLPPGRDSLLNLTKEEIIEKAINKQIKIPYEDSLQDLNLVIGIWTDKTDSIDSEIYSLRVHQPDYDIENSLDIIEINTDQKILCNPTQISGNEYRCLFVVTYDNEDVNMKTPLLAYASSINHGALSYIYANFISRNLFDEYRRAELISNIPTYQNAELNSRKEGVDYIYLQNLQKEKYMFISVIADKSDAIMIFTSMPVYNYISYDFFEFYPNPSTEQLLSVPGETLRLAFPGSDSVTVNIVSLNGHAEISWKSDPNTIFIMRGFGDRISLSSGNNIDELIIRRLNKSNTHNDTINNLEDMEDPGFVFYVSYIIKNNKVKFSEISYGKSLEIAYMDVDLPVSLYSKIGSEYSDVNVAITFKDNEIDKGGIYESSPLIISAILVKESVIYEAKKDEDLRPIDKAIKGYYDTALKTAQVFLSENIIKNFNIKDSDNPTIYIRIDKNEKADLTFDKFAVEAQVSGVNDGVIPVEKIYHYGRVRNTAWENTLYRLKADKKRPIMRVQIAFNSKNLDFVVSDTENKISNTTFLHCEKNKGKIYVTLKIKENKELYYLYIYKKSKTSKEEYLNNYAFKYINAGYESQIFDYPILNSPELSISEKTEEGQYIISCTFNRLDIEEGQANITYFFKVVENSTYYYGEEINTIAATESPYYTVYERNPVADNDKITLVARGNLSNWVYLNVIAQVQQNHVLEYISYNGIIILKPDKDKNYLLIFLAIGGALLIIVLVLLLVIFIIYRRNKQLLNKVTHVSFQKGGNNSDPNLLLQKSNQSSD